VIKINIIHDLFLLIADGLASIRNGFKIIPFNDTHWSELQGIYQEGIDTGLDTSELSIRQGHREDAFIFFDPGK